MKKFIIKLLLGSGAFVNHFIDLSTAHKNAIQVQANINALLTEHAKQAESLKSHTEAFQVAKANLTEAFKFGE